MKRRVLPPAKLIPVSKAKRIVITDQKIVNALVRIVMRSVDPVEACQIGGERN